MYIKYTMGQRAADERDTDRWCQATGGTHRPTWLIRTSDWTRIPGSEAKNGYCTLSYCWEQSGEIIQKDDGEYDCIDNGHHRLTTYHPKHLWNCFRRRSTKQKTYEEIIQRICLDFDIDYLWYDKICINQTNKAEKLREIKQMHLIYGNARYTLAMVPEIEVKHTGDFTTPTLLRISLAKFNALHTMETVSRWWKRSWTLEELMVSKRILILGSNTYLWCEAVSDEQYIRVTADEPLSMRMLDFSNRKWTSANQVLRHAHFRTSAKEHDKVFALANIFHNNIPIHIDYSSEVPVVMNAFYRTVAEQDLSVMCFGSIILNPDGKRQFETTMDKYNLPSWTGVAGLHVANPISNIALCNDSNYTVDSRMRLHLNCRYYTIRPTKFESDDFIVRKPQRYKKAHVNTQKPVNSLDDLEGDEQLARDWSLFSMMYVTSCDASHYWTPDKSQFTSPVTPLSLTEDCEECVIVSVLFDSIRPNPVEFKHNGSFMLAYEHSYLLPVLKKSTNSSTYKAIGTILIKQYQWYESPQSSKEYVDELFGGLCDQPSHFIVE